MRRSRRPDRVRHRGAIVVGVNGRSTVNDSLEAGADRRLARTHDADGDHGPRLRPRRRPSPSSSRTCSRLAGRSRPRRSDPDVLGRRRDREHRQRGSLLRAVHADPHVRSHVRPDVLADGPLHRQAQHAGPVHGRPAAHRVTRSTRSPDPKTQQPVDNGRRDIWVTYTALTTALNTSYMASQLALFSLVVGIALLLSGIGFRSSRSAERWRARRRRSASSRSAVGRRSPSRGLEPLPSTQRSRLGRPSLT